MLKINGLSKAFGSNIVLSDATFEIERSEIIGLAGNSGSGKSTLLRLVQGLETPDSGTIQGEARTGFMFQDFQLFPHMTVWKNIIYAPTVRKMGGNPVKTAKKFAALLGLSKKLDVYPRQLSGGQKQRVALARTLMMTPDLFLCDEPTSGLDMAAIEDVIALMEFTKKLGISMLIASHDLYFLTKISDIIFVLKNGILTQKIRQKTLKDPIGYIKNIYHE